MRRSASTRAAITNARAPAGCLRCPVSRTVAAAVVAARYQLMETVDSRARRIKMKRRCSTASILACRDRAICGPESAGGTEERALAAIVDAARARADGFRCGQRRGRRRRRWRRAGGGAGIARAVGIAGPERFGAIRNRFPAEDQGTRLRRRRDRRARLDVRRGGRRRPGDRRAAGEAVDAGRESRRLRGED